MATEFQIKRIYDEPDDNDGYRILIDRLWPRGITKAKAKIDLWPKDFTPSTDLRKWFHANSSLYDEFVVRYLQELEEQRAEIEQTIESIAQPTITLVTSVKEPEQSHAVVLQQFLINLS
ncbi:DUF488 domain-containing protein [Gimesia aquarii]|uniref:Uncharacterized protein n=1 Tax=Gimesia aquarii TaxID=2527964 RepID=A0A517WR88_9PLAN|nr:DUF488 family protein [Gimesia aquarii]QDU07738.1 hypothetical protein V202x_10990 [Gimesia aquarii]